MTISIRAFFHASYKSVNLALNTKNHTRHIIYIISIIKKKKLYYLYTGALSTDCGYPGAPAHSSVRFTGPTIDDVIDEEDGPIGGPTGTRLPLAPGTVATYACERGFELLGPARRQCQDDGTWSPEGVPFCGEFIFFEKFIYKNDKILKEK